MSNIRTINPRPGALTLTVLFLLQFLGAVVAIPAESTSTQDNKVDVADLFGTRPKRQLLVPEFVYKPNAAKPTSECDALLGEFGKWLAFQQKIMGVKVAQASFVKRHGEHIVLYVKATEDFVGKDSGWKLAIIQGMVKFWCVRCIDAKKSAYAENLHVAIVAPDEDKVIGGSREVNGCEVWCDKH